MTVFPALCAQKHKALVERLGTRSKKAQKKAVRRARLDEKDAEEAAEQVSEGDVVMQKAPKQRKVPKATPMKE